MHWLNSLEGGNACLLVDCYRELSDGVALEEAFILIEVGAPFEVWRSSWRYFQPPLSGDALVCQGHTTKKALSYRTIFAESGGRVLAGSDSS